MDESAYISQSFYGDLLCTGRRDHPAWLDYAGFDLPPLPKYVIAGALWAANFRRPDLSDARSWYRDTSRQFVPLPALVAARRPSVVLGAIGCLAIYWIGTILGDRRVGCLAAVLLAINPLYRLHARRAMSDVPAECFMLLALWCGLIVWRRAAGGTPRGRSWILIGPAGVMVGLATLSKLNGVLGGLVLACWVALALVSPAFTRRAKTALAGGMVVAAGVAFGTFVLLDPYLTARPRGPLEPGIAEQARLSFGARVREVYDHRARVSRGAMGMFPKDALPTLPARVAAVLVQGFGRFGPFGPPGRSDSTVRFEWRQDRGVLLWFPAVAAAAVLALGRGWREWRDRLPPAGWLPLAYLVVVGGVVTSFVPLAWDRYFLSIQAPAALMAALGAGAAVDRLVGRRAQVGAGVAP